MSFLHLFRNQSSLCIKIPYQYVMSPSARPEQVDLLGLHEELPVDVPGEVVAQLDGAKRGTARDLVVNAQLGFKLVDDTVVN